MSDIELRESTTMRLIFQSVIMGAALAASCAYQAPPETVVPLSDEDRAVFFQAAIRNAGFPCEDVTGVVEIDEFGESW